MTLLKQINEKGAVLEWSPIASQPNVVALGTKDSSGVGFDDYGGELELHSLDFRDAEQKGTTILGKISANSRFSSIAWSQMALYNEEYPFGLIAGGMNDGFVHIWNPSKLATDDPDALIASIEQHQGGIRGLQFNPHKESSHLLSSGGSDGEVYVLSLERPDEPNIFVPAPSPNNSKHTAEISKVAWNTQVAYILASAAVNGSSYVWDLRQKKAWCELRDPTGGPVADIAWNPDQGLHIITASGDDKNPVIKLWDLRSSTSLPLATLQGHTQGILSTSWCPTDASLLLSCGKDNQTILWDLFNLQPVYNLPSQDNASNDSNSFGGLASTAGQRRYHVSWSPCLPAVIGACSFDRKIQFYSLSGVRSKLGRAPKWLRKPIGATFGFGGKLVSFTNKNFSSDPIADSKKPSGSFLVTVSQVIEDKPLINDIEFFHNTLASGDIKNFCDYKITTTNIPHEKDIWSLIKVVSIETNARTELMKFLGYTKESVTTNVANYLQSINPIVETESLPISPPKSLKTIESAHDLFATDTLVNSLPINPPIKNETIDISIISPEILQLSKEIAIQTVKSKEAEPMILQSILIGNFEAAVDCCLTAGLYAEALVLSQCGDPSLYQKTQEKFFQLEKSKKSNFLTILFSILKSDLVSYINISDLSKWKETLALINTYSKSNEFQKLCELLGNRLENEVNDMESSLLCYICSGNTSKTIQYFTNSLIKSSSKQLLSSNDLQQYIEKVMIYIYNNKSIELSKEVLNYFSQYGKILASYGRIDYAMKYLTQANSVEVDNVLLDRLYHSSSKTTTIRPPTFPFTKVDVRLVPISVDAKPKVKTTTTNVAVPAPINQTTNVPTLPAGWLEFTDPASGRQYYVNQATNQSQWEFPIVKTQPVVPQPYVQPQNPVVKSQPVSQFQQPVQNIQPSSVAQPNTFNQATMNSYNQQNTINQPISAFQQTNQNIQQNPINSFNQPNPNSFIQPNPNSFIQPNPNSFNQPNLNSFNQPNQTSFNQSNNFVQPNATPVPVSTPVPNVFIPQPAISTPSPQPLPTVASKPTSTLNQSVPIQSVQPVVAPVAPVKEPVPIPESVLSLNGIISQISATITNPGDKRQITAVNQSFNILCEKISNGEVSPDVLQKVISLIQELSTRSYVTANAIQVDLANTVWSQHKEWLKGIKILIQLASKKS